MPRQRHVIEHGAAAGMDEEQFDAMLGLPEIHDLRPLALVAPRHRGQMFDGRTFEQGRQRQLFAEVLLYLDQQPQGEQRMAAEIEKIIGDADRADVEERLPYLRQQQFGGIARRDIVAFEIGANSAGRRQTIAIEFLVRRQRQAIEKHEARWDHRRRQALAQKFAQGSRTLARALGRHDVGDQRGPLGAVAMRHHCASRDIGA
jgi:hypothetical protein